MNNPAPFTTKRALCSMECQNTGKFAHVYDNEDGTYRIRFGLGIHAGTTYAGLKQDDAQELSAMWMTGASLDEMHIAAYRAGVR